MPDDSAAPDRGARDCLLRAGFLGRDADFTWQGATSWALLDQAARLMQEYGVAVDACGPLRSSRHKIERGWYFGGDHRDGKHLVTVDQAAEWAAWRVQPPDRWDEDRLSRLSELPFRPDITFDHVRREVFGAVVTRRDGEPLRRLGEGQGQALRLTPLESLVEAILQRVVSR